jgi:hypothetical protein
MTRERKISNRLPSSVAAGPFYEIELPYCRPQRVDSARHEPTVLWVPKASVSRALMRLLARELSSLTQCFISS